MEKILAVCEGEPEMPEDPLSSPSISTLSAHRLQALAGAGGSMEKALDGSSLSHTRLSARFLLLTVSSPAFRRLLSLRGCCCISAHLSLPSLLLPLPEPLQRPCTTLHLQPSSSLLLRAARAHPSTFLHYPLALPATHYHSPLLLPRGYHASHHPLH